MMIIILLHIIISVFLLPANNKDYIIITFNNPNFYPKFYLLKKDIKNIGNI